MQRKNPFNKNEYYHLYSRGVEKRKIFLNKKDYERFTALLYIMNQPSSFRMDNFLQKKIKLEEIYKIEREKTLVSIISYCLMPNHFHIMVYEHTQGGISKFMSKLMTAYSMYFNTKYERSGPLFTRPFRSQHVGNESHFMYLFSYINLNPLSVLDSKWKENGISDLDEAENYLNNYEFSSRIDLRGSERPKSKILDKNNFPEYIDNLLPDLKTFYKSQQGEFLLG